MINFALLAGAMSMGRIPSELERHTFKYDGLDRSYWVYASEAALTEALPLVIVLHGGRGTGDRMAKITGFNAVADEGPFIAVYPDGVNRRWNDGREPDARTDDVGFLIALVDQLAESHGIDRTRVYATGASNGGMMAFRLACEAPEHFAAIAGVIAAIPAATVRAWTPSAPMPVLIMNGDADPILPWGGGEVKVQRTHLGKVISTAETVDFWVRHNECNPTLRVEQIASPDPDSGMAVRVETYVNGRDGSEVSLYAIMGGGHTWPGGLQYMPEWLIGPTCRYLNGSRTIWRFFQRFRRNPDR